MLAIAGAVVVGLLGAPHGEDFGWEVAAVTGTGFATLVLATFTGMLASSTSRDVSATQELARLAQEERDAANEPYLIVGEVTTTAGVQPSSGIAYQAVIYNVGRGPATNIIYEAYVRRRDGSIEGELGFGMWPVILAGQAIEVGVTVAQVERREDDTFSVRGTYLDRDGQPIERYAFGENGPRDRRQRAA